MDGPVEDKKSNGSFDSFVHVEMSDLVDAPNGDVKVKTTEGAEKEKGKKEKEKDKKKVKEDNGVIVQDVVPKEVQMQLLASAIDGEVGWSVLRPWICFENLVTCTRTCALISLSCTSGYCGKG